MSSLNSSLSLLASVGKRFEKETLLLTSLNLRMRQFILGKERTELKGGK